MQIYCELSLLHFVAIYSLFCITYSSLAQFLGLHLLRFTEKHLFLNYATLYCLNMWVSLDSNRTLINLSKYLFTNLRWYPHNYFLQKYWIHIVSPMSKIIALLENIYLLRVFHMKCKSAVPTNLQKIYCILFELSQDG